MIFTESITEQSPLRKELDAIYRADETACVNKLLDSLDLTEGQLNHIQQTARELVIEVRKERVGKGGLDSFLYRYDLSSEEGIALMCLAEALLRIPDNKTIGLLIKDKITSADWQSNVGKSDSLFVNAATWGLMLTGRVLSRDQENPNRLRNVLKRFIEKTGEPIIRRAVGEMMKILGKQFILGENIEEALKRSVEREEIGYRFSYDMLGEAARTQKDAERYFTAYQNSIQAIGQHAKGRGYIAGPGISVKLSALHPRYEFSKRFKIVPDLVEKLTSLVLQAKEVGIGLTVDAEEADRLDLSLDILEAVFADPRLEDWEGLGLAVQAYQKRAFYLIDWLADQAKKHKRRWMLRLVKGAYWDSEIKESQVKGYNSYPVYTRKVNTDLSYIACVKKIIESPTAFYPMFATHNAHTVAVILELMGNNRDFEFQCLQGMGRALYDQIVAKDKRDIPCRVYAPVGSHEDLLPYLVRRLLENGANTSFVNRIVDEQLPIKDIIGDPISKVKENITKPHPHIPLPGDLYGSERRNAKSYDLSNIEVAKTLDAEMSKWQTHQWQAKPSLRDATVQHASKEVYEPNNRTRILGKVSDATTDEIEFAIDKAFSAREAWDRTPVANRAHLLQVASDLLEEHMPELMALIIREGGKTLPDAIAEVREAVDFCRYYAVKAQEDLAPKSLVGPTGETNQLQMHGRGVFVCISPWNFPLAIFSGQVMAALVAGNSIIAKPAAQTPLIAARAVEIFHQAGIPKHVLQLLPGEGRTVGNTLISDERISGVLFTGSTETARHINKTLAERKGPIIPFIAETGGQNAMIADSSALPEQLVMDVLSSAFYSAGQRCSALRVLFIQEELADKVIKMLQGAMSELVINDSTFLETDIGPIIDEKAVAGLEAHAQKMQTVGKLIHEATLGPQTENGAFFAPRAFEIASLSMLEREVFGPILHVIRYKQNALDQVIAAINETGYGLTLGIQSRIDETIRYIQQRVHAGNTYVNRNMIGAVVGVQPFGGEGLSGTGPKAGGPHYLSRLCVERTVTVNTTAAGGNASLLSLLE
ncbi:MAG: bifunctional proline dehydrogenase/L-glutamate gamma-semialdehyde dehydrogenase PutA [Gammaproteobacteria bacterium]|nr:bifunctional proline dehydrogenase/L-glutamate gamma-semialdehyde dehydrogenase PutA [Gammaproteobacteria bacterium]